MTDTQSQQAAPTGSRYNGQQSNGLACDLGAIDNLQCEAEGIRVEADLTSKFAAKLADRRKQLDGARKAYTDARAAALEPVNDQSDRLEDLHNTLDCMLTEDERQRLAAAHGAVLEELEAGGTGTVSCCLDDDGVFDTEFGELGDQEVHAQLHARIADFERRVTAAEECFDRLVAEPKNLADRVKNLIATVTALGGELNGNGDAPDLRTRSYIKVLVADRDRQTVYGGFDDSNQYYDCLCRTLTCVLTGRRAVTELSARLAVRQCRDKAARARRDAMLKNVVDEVLARHQQTNGQEPRPAGGAKGTKKKAPTAAAPSDEESSEE